MLLLNTYIFVTSNFQAYTNARRTAKIDESGGVGGGGFLAHAISYIQVGKDQF
jgi:hypothetical protein